MKTINTVILFFLTTLLYSQAELKELLAYVDINKKDVFKNYEKNSDSIVYCNDFNFSDFSYEKSEKSIEEFKFKLFYQNNMIKFIIIKEHSFEYKIYISNYIDYKLWIFENGVFCISKNKNILFFDTELKAIDDETASIIGLEGIYFMDSNFNPLRSLELNNGLPLSTSVFSYKNNKIYEEIIIDKGKMYENKECYNVYERKIKSLFLKLEHDFMNVCSYFKKFNIELEDNDKSFLWFLNRKQKMNIILNDEK